MYEDSKNWFVQQGVKLYINDDLSLLVEWEVQLGSHFVYVWKSIMHRLHLPDDEYTCTMPVRCPNHRFRAASAGRPCDHRTALLVSWPLRFCFTPHNDKFEKIVSPYVARRHIAVTSYDPRTIPVRVLTYLPRIR